MIRKYNEKFINQFDEQKYINILQTVNHLDALRYNYNYRYNSSYNVFDCSLNFLKESLDHYVLKRMEQDSSFINTVECNNYFNYLKKLSNENMYDYHTNVVLYNVLNNLKFSNYKQKYIGINENKFRDKINKNNLKLNSIIKKIKNNQVVSQNELDLTCGVISDYRENAPITKQVVKYIFNNLTKQDSRLRCSPQVVSAILTYIPYTCNEIKKNGFDPSTVRICASNKRQNLDYTGVGCSLGDIKQIILNGRKFSNVNFKSMKASESTYPSNIPENDDWTLLMIVAYHEITHQYQAYMSKIKMDKFFINNDFFSVGLSMALKNILNEELRDYSENHDNDDIEIHATQLGWKMCNQFYSDVLYDGALKSELIKRSTRNMHELVQEILLW